MFLLLRDHFKLLFFCLITAFFGGLGQTYFVAQFIPYIQEGLNLSNSYISGAYSIATLSSALCLSWIGKQIDLKPLHVLLPTVLCTLALGFSLTAFAIHFVLLVLGFFLLRVSGQMTLGLIPTTLVGRYFGRKRGKALTLVSFGRAMAEGLLPAFALFLIAYLGWRLTLSFMGFLPLIVVMGLYFWMRKSIPTGVLYDERDDIKKVRTRDKSEGAEEGEGLLVEWTWMHVLRERRSFLLMLANSFMGFLVTGLFFQQGVLAEYKDWPMSVFASGFVVYSIFNVVGNISFGYLVDSLGARRLLPFVLCPLILSVFSLIFWQGAAGVFVYMGLLGAGVGASSLVRNAFWAEAYDLKVLGRLKGMDGSLSVLGTGVAPFLFGILLDRGVEMQLLLWSGIVAGIFTSLLYTYLSCSYR